MKKSLGQINHVHSDGSISTLEVGVLEFEKREDMNPVVTITNEYGNSSVIVNSLNQWEQLDILVRKGFKDIEDKEI